MDRKGLSIHKMTDWIFYRERDNVKYMENTKL